MKSETTKKKMLVIMPSEEQHGYAFERTDPLLFDMINII